MTKEDIPVITRMRLSLTEAIEGKGRTQRRPSPAIRWAGALAAAAAVVILAVVLLGPARSPAPVVDPSVRALPTPEQTLGSGVGSCVETFTVENLSKRAFAFDGVISSIEVPDAESAPTLVTFDVTHWYTGGDGPTAQLRTYARPGGITSASLGQQDAAQLEVGARVLASGEDDFLWECGFSMLYTPGNAEIFAAAFDG